MQIEKPEIYENLLSGVLQAPQVMIWVSNAQHRCVYGNKACLDFLGYSFEECADLKWQDYLHPEDAGQVQKNYELALRQHPVIKQEFRARKKNGEYAWMLDICSPRFSDEGRFLGYIGSLVDITEKRIREEELKHKQNQLIREILKISEWEQHRISADLHDGLAQNMVSISLKSMALENKLKIRDLPEFLAARDIASETERVLAGVRNLCQVLFPVKLTRFEFQAAMRNLAVKLHQEFEIQTELKLDPEAVPLDPERALLLFRIAQEGLTNAARHGRTKRIDVFLRAGRDNMSVLEVLDDGIGISKDPFASARLGMRIMSYRAHLLGAELEIGRNRKGGAVLRCHFRSAVK